MAVLTSATFFVAESPCQRKVMRTLALSPAIGSTSGVPTRWTLSQKRASATRASRAAAFCSAVMVGLVGGGGGVVRAPIDAAKGIAAASISA